MIIQSAQTLSFSSTTAGEQTVTLKASRLYSGIRMYFTYTDAAGAAGPISNFENLSSIVVDAPEYGSNSRRLDLSGNTMALLPLCAQLGAVNAKDAASATSVHSTSPIQTEGGGTLNTAGYSYVDIPVNKRSLSEDLRVTISGQVATNGDTLVVSFAFLDYPMRNAFFRAYDQTNVSTAQQWFPADATLRGVVVAGYTTGWTAGAANAFAFGTRNNDVTQISLNGEQETTFSNPEVLAPGLDECINGGPSGNANSWNSFNSFGMLKNFPARGGAQYVSIDAASGTGDYLVLAVMSDA
jgi:hypothetical protein